MNKKDPCDKCGKPSVKEEYCPVSLLLGQEIKWNYCEDCYKEDLKLIPMMKAKFPSEKDFNDMLDTIKS